MVWVKKYNETSGCLQCRENDKQEKLKICMTSGVIEKYSDEGRHKRL